MALNGVDIASWQAGLDIGTIDADFVIVKATQGTSYVNPYCAGWVDAALARGLKVGVYHYISGGDATGEAEFFYSQCHGWDNRVMWCLDWESGSNTAWGNTDYLATVIDTLTRFTGKPPMVYASYSGYPFDVVDARNCGRWIAQYANNNSTGYQTSPWNEDAYTCAIRQYSSAGRISGYSGNLDLNKFYGDAAAWDAYVTGGSSENTTEVDMTDEQAAQLAEIYYQVTRVDDCSGRDMALNDHDHIKWIASSVADINSEVTRRDDVSGRGVEMTTHEQLNWMAAKQAQMYAAMAKICEKLEIEFGSEEY